MSAAACAARKVCCEGSLACVRAEENRGILRGVMVELVSLRSLRGHAVLFDPVDKLSDLFLEQVGPISASAHVHPVSEMIDEVL